MRTHHSPLDNRFVRRIRGMRWGRALRKLLSLLNVMAGATCRRLPRLRPLLVAGAAITAIAAITVATALATRLVLVLLGIFGLMSDANAQTSPAFGPISLSASMPPVSTEGTSRDVDVMSLSDYLGLLRQISPAAETGARDYLAAFLLRCGREMTTAELHRSLAGATGDPVLMAHVRAAQLREPGMRQQLARLLRCPTGVAR